MKIAPKWLMVLSFMLMTNKTMLFAQPANKTITDKLFVDKQGVLRWKNTNAEATFFGVNYTVPFAYGYRSHKALGVDIEKAIDADVYHMARLGLDAFRVHVWDTEITDSAGNLLANEHLRLFDYLIYKLKERNIKILITPIAFWGNGYPERDEKTKGFSSIYPKQKALVNDTAIAAQENYLKQFFKHINPYTKLTYHDDEAVVAMEINNEPQHSGPKKNVTDYVNRMTKAVKSTGWSKPVFYNISESPTYADAVAKAAIDGVSFQWYPTGLVANHTLQGNYLPHVDQYKIPFGDTIPQYMGKARMVYEFDAGDVLQPIMYPAMARSFRTAGFQWATQFAYDPLATAYANTEYQTHFINLAYTPSKAISLMIAAKAFHEVPRLKSYGAYPADTTFESIRISYQQQLSEMNAEEHFYYSNTTNSTPKAIQALKHIAGVGQSPVVQYDGTGAYFLDKVVNGIWRLEVMPDAVVVEDPFGRASPKRAAVEIFNHAHTMQLNLPDLGNTFMVKALNSGNDFSKAVTNGKILLKAGTYLLMNANQMAMVDEQLKLNNIRLNEFVMPQLKATTTKVWHQAMDEVSAAKPVTLHFQINNLSPKDSVFVQYGKMNWQLKTMAAERVSIYDYKAVIPADVVTPGVLQYKLIIKKSDGSYTQYPGGLEHNPFAWDNYHQSFFQTNVAAPKARLAIFNANSNKNNTNLYLPDWRNYSAQYVTADKPQQLVLQLNGNAKNGPLFFGMQHFIGDKLIGRVSELSSFTKLVIRARVINQPTAFVKVGLIQTDAATFAKTIPLTSEFQDIEMALTELQPADMLLLPRPYPGFLPLWFSNRKAPAVDVKQIEKLQVVIDNTSTITNYCNIEIESIWLK
jgi:hypothetical protein